MKLLDPNMPTQELRLHCGELSANEVLVARAAIEWANSRAIALQEESDRLMTPSPKTLREITEAIYGTRVAEYAPAAWNAMRNSDEMQKLLWRG